jgi:hypothetical protein
MIDLSPRLASSLPPAARDWWAAAGARVREPGALPELFPQLPRRLGRTVLAAERLTAGDITLELSAWRVCDVGALTLLQRARPADAGLVDLFQHGDTDERAMVLRTQAALPITAATVQFLGEVQRSNIQPLFEALLCESNLLARARRHPQVGAEPVSRTLLKAAFLGIPLARLLEVETCANPELSRMLQDLATEREAAGRAIWTDTDRLTARAPTAGTVARILGGLEHGDDLRRLAAAEGLLLLRRPELAAFARERLPREPRSEIRAVLEKATHSPP